jgi:hypothetical protein
MTNLYTVKDLEILIATRDRLNLDFLSSMFPFKKFFNFNILIINQSKEGVLVSDYSSIRVINSKEIGLSKSRNLAINNAVKKICLIADDDVVYSENFDKHIISAFSKLINPAIVTFNHQRIGLDKPKNNSPKAYKHTLKSILNVCSIEIAFRLDEIKKNKIYFDEYFGLGSFFETSEENLFLRKALGLKLDSYYYPSVIVSHPLLSSGTQEGKDELIFARSALIYKTKGNYVYFWLLKYLFFLLRNNYIKGSECFEKFKIGLSGINKLKELKENNTTKDKSDERKIGFYT